MQICPCFSGHHLLSLCLYLEGWRYSTYTPHICKKKKKWAEQKLFHVDYHCYKHFVKVLGEKKEKGETKRKTKEITWNGSQKCSFLIIPIVSVAAFRCTLGDIWNKAINKAREAFKCLKTTEQLNIQLLLSQMNGLLL